MHVDGKGFLVGHFTLWRIPRALLQECGGLCDMMMWTNKILT